MHPSFEDFLISKKIDSDKLRQTKPQLWQEWKENFEQLSPTSFTDQKLYLINPLRREFPLTEDF